MRKPKTELTEAIKALTPRPKPGCITQTRQYRLITPLFGGGVKPGQVDDLTPIRGTAIRGHLRFWWRATRGGQFGKDGLKRMKAKEDEIWGAAATAAQVSLSVTYANDASRRGTKFQDSHKRNGNPLPIGDPASKTGYAAFPLRQTKQEATEKEVRTGIAFTLTISFASEYRPDVAAALWAWETFGGIGARTRRGFGAVTCFAVTEDGQTIDPRYTTTHLKTDLQRDVRTHLQAGENFPQHVPHLHTDMATLLRVTHLAGSSNGVNIWIALIDALQSFRHKRPQNKVRENNRESIRPGRNRWPEPDAIRDKVKPRPRKYLPTIHTPPIHKVPRAAFGLPIIFEFKGENGMPQVTLEGAKQEQNRFASPLLLRPLACQNDRYVGIALVLAGSHVHDIPGGLILKNAPGNPPITAQLTPGEAGQIAREAKQINPNDNYNGDPDILQAFLHTL